MGLGRRGGKSGSTCMTSSAPVLRTTGVESPSLAEVMHAGDPDDIRIEMEARGFSLGGYVDSLFYSLAFQECWHLPPACKPEHEINKGCMNYS